MCIILQASRALVIYINVWTIIYVFEGYAEFNYIILHLMYEKWFHWNHGNSQTQICPYYWRITNLTMAGPCQNGDQGLYSLSGWTSYRKISWSLKPRNLDLVFSNHSEIWRAIRQLPRCLPNFRAIRSLIIPSRGFETSRDLAVRRPSA